MDLARINASFVKLDNTIDWVAVRGQFINNAPSIALARLKMLKVAAVDFGSVILSLGQLAETRANLISIDKEKILVAEGGDYTKFILDWYLKKENLYKMLDFYYSFKTALD